MSYLKHHGILGQKWGVRRYQNEDGSYTNKGRKRHAEDYLKTGKDKIIGAVKIGKEKVVDTTKKGIKVAKKSTNDSITFTKKQADKVKTAAKKPENASKIKTAKKIATGILIGYGAYKVASFAAKASLGTKVTRSVLKKYRGTGSMQLSSMTMRDLSMLDLY